MHIFNTLPSATDDEDWMNDYPIADKYKDHFDDIAPRWHVTPLPAFDASGNFIKTCQLKGSLRGALVLVYFQLRHYPIRNKRTNGITSNTFSVTATLVKILECGPECHPSPYKSLLMKGPMSLSQSPTKRKDQVNTVHTFHRGMACSFLLSRSQTCPVPAGSAAPNIDDIKGLSGITGDTMVMVGSLKVDEKKQAVDEEDKATATDNETSVGLWV